MLRAIARILLWPFRRFFDPRFQGVVDRVDASRHEGEVRHQEVMLAQQEARAVVDELHGLIRADMEATSEAVTVIGRSLRGIEAALAPIEERGGVRDQTVLAAPFVFRALAAVPAGASVLVVGAGESSLCLSLATTGYRVTAVDGRLKQVSHPNLRQVGGTVEGLEGDGAFEASVCFSPRRAETTHRIRELTESGGRLVLTGNYDRRGLDVLLEGWKIDELAILAREGDTMWVSLDSAQPEKDDRECVAIVVATRLS